MGTNQTHESDLSRIWVWNVKVNKGMSIDKSLIGRNGTAAPARCRYARVTIAHHRDVVLMTVEGELHVSTDSVSVLSSIQTHQQSLYSCFRPRKTVTRINAMLVNTNVTAAVLVESTRERIIASRLMHVAPKRWVK